MTENQLFLEFMDLYQIFICRYLVKPSCLSFFDLFTFEQKERRESLAMQIVCKETKNYYGSFCQNNLSGQLWQSGKFISDPVSNSFSSFDFEVSENFLNVL